MVLEVGINFIYSWKCARFLDGALVAGDAGMRVMTSPACGVPARTRATRWQIWRGRMRERAGALLSWLGFPGALTETVIDDPLTGRHIEIRVGALFTRISIDGRDYYFDRVSGEAAGTGSGCA